MPQDWKVYLVAEFSKAERYSLAMIAFWAVVFLGAFIAMMTG